LERGQLDVDYVAEGVRGVRGYADCGYRWVSGGGVYFIYLGGGGEGGRTCGAVFGELDPFVLFGVSFLSSYTQSSR